MFTQEPFTGNPLAVFPEAEGLTSEEMMKIAREMNLSETVFVLRPDKPDGKSDGADAEGENAEAAPETQDDGASQNKSGIEASSKEEEIGNGQPSVLRRLRIFTLF